MSVCVFEYTTMETVTAIRWAFTFLRSHSYVFNGIRSFLFQKVANHQLL